MAQNQANTTQSTPVYTPTVGASYGNGWRQMRKYFLELFLIGIIGFVIGLPSGIGEEVTAASVLSVLGLIYGILIVCPTEYGVSFAYLKAARSDKLKIWDMFEAFHNYWNAVLANILVSGIVVIGFFLLIIPGIIFACKLAFTPYLIVDRKMEVIEAIKESWRMTNGHAWTIFFIGLLSIVIIIGGLLFFVVGVIPALMWILVTQASLYHAVMVPSEIKVA